MSNEENEKVDNLKPSKYLLELSQKNINLDKIK